MESFFKSNPAAIGFAVAAFLLGSALFGGGWGLACAVIGYLAGHAIDSKRL
jgi:hypothetical protein